MDRSGRARGGETLNTHYPTHEKSIAEAFER
jgi:hypothetical protein